jgi:hypothetical protein
MLNIWSQSTSAASCGLKGENLSYNYLIKHLRKRWGIDMGFLDFGTRWRFMSVPAAFLQEDFPRNSLDMVLGRLQTQSGFYSKEKKSCSCRLQNHDSSDVQYGAASLQRLTGLSWFPLCKVGHSNSSIQLKFHICLWESSSLMCYSAWRLSSDLQHVHLHLIICIAPCAIRIQLQESFRNTSGMIGNADFNKLYNKMCVRWGLGADIILF